jgi:hypothetical protein
MIRGRRGKQSLVAINVELAAVAKSSRSRRSPQATAITLGQSQLLTQWIENSDINSRAMALFLFNGAALALVVSAQKDLGHHWVISLAGLVLSVVACVLAARAPRTLELSAGPNLELFYEKFGTDATEFQEKLRNDLIGAWKRNDVGLRRKRVWLTRGFVALGATAVYSAYLALIPHTYLLLSLVDLLA